jgi:hypothetical protein
MTIINGQCKIGVIQPNGNIKYLGLFDKVRITYDPPTPLDRTDKIKAILSSLKSLLGVTEVHHCSIFEHDDSGAYWDATWRFWLSFSSSKKPDLWVALDELKDRRAVSIQQVQCVRDRGNRWLYKLGDARSAVVRAVAAALPDYQLATPDGDQKVDQILAQHGGFTVRELEEMGWEEWLDGKEVVPRLRRQYGRCPDGYRWGEAVGRKTRLLVKLADPPGAPEKPPSCPPAA